MLEFFLYAAAVAMPFNTTEFKDVPVDPDPVTSGDLIIGAGEAVRAATWDTLSNPPSEPTQVHLACLVPPALGIPGHCLPASLLSPRSKKANWTELLRQADIAARSYSAAQMEIENAARERISTFRLKTDPSKGSNFEIRIFNLTVSPADALPRYTPGDTLPLEDVGLSQPMEGKLVSALYPPLPLRYDISGRVTVNCRIKEDRTLLCRDPGNVQLLTPIPAELALEKNDLARIVERSFLLATYQAASTVKVNAADKDGNDAIGRDLTFILAWRPPQM